MSYLGDLGITLAVELPVVAAVAHAAAIRTRGAVAVGVLANALTHPLLWFVVAPWAHDRIGLAGVAIAEVGVVAIEAAVYCRRLRELGLGLAVGLAVLANSLSWGVGIVVHAVNR